MCSLGFAQRVRAVELGASKKQVDSSEIAALKKRIKELEVWQHLINCELLLTHSSIQTGQ